MIRILHEVHVHLVAVFYLFLKHYISNFYISVESFWAKGQDFFFSQKYLMDYSLISSSLSLQFNFFCHYQIVEEQRPGVATVKRCLTDWALCGALACGSGCCGLVMVWIAWRQCCSCLCLWDYSSPDLGLVISHYRFPIKQGDPL